MNKQRFQEIEDRNKNDKFSLCYELFVEEKNVIPRETFDSLFSIWLQMHKGGDINAAIEFFKNNKLK